MDKAGTDKPEDAHDERPDGGAALAAELIMGRTRPGLDLAGQAAQVMDRLALDAHTGVSAADRYWQIATHLWPALKTVARATGHLTGTLLVSGVDADLLAGVGPHPHYPHDPGRHLTVHAAIPPTEQWPHHELSPRHDLSPLPGPRPAPDLGTTGGPGRHDLVLTNLPFHDADLLDPARRTRLGIYHREVLASALERTRPGELTVAIASPVFLDHPDPHLRAQVHQQADLVGAVRLPSGAMRPDSHAEGPTDILFLHHRLPGQPGPGIPRAREVTINNERGHLSQYWLDRPDHVLGRLVPSVPGSFTALPGREPLGHLLQVAFDQIAGTTIDVLTARPATRSPGPRPGPLPDAGSTQEGQAPHL